MHLRKRRNTRTCSGNTLRKWAGSGVFHATPRKNNLYWYEDRPEKFFREMAGKADADIMVYGHTHKPYRKDFNGRIFINAGSVGKRRRPQGLRTWLK
jgi:UDP-2,3-diacylglucosamine pyrophosphatase LpxH